MDKEYLIGLKECGKTFGSGTASVEALKKTTMTFAKGYNFIYGKSGSGKSTLLNVLASLEKPTTGEVIYKGHSLYDYYDIPSLRRNEFGFVFQSYNLIEDFNVWDNIILPLRFEGSKDYEVLDKIIQPLGLEDKLKRYPKTLSGGEQQRVAIARALVAKPKIVFADEPTGNLDAKNSETVIRLLIDMCKEFGASLFVVTHDMELLRYADYIYNIIDGNIHQER